SGRLRRCTPGIRRCSPRCCPPRPPCTASARRSRSVKVLVTGAAGFIGAKVSELLVRHGHEVVGFDNLNDAYDTRLKDWRLARRAGLGGLEFGRGDVSDSDAVAALLAGRRFDAVVNLAARAGVRPSVENPWPYVATNVVGTLNLLEAARRHGV